MITIRLQRTGRENTPTYRIVVAEKARPVKGKTQEVLGHFLPAQKTPTLSYDRDALIVWVKRGAVVSDTLARLLTRDGVPGLEKFIRRYAKRKPKNAAEEATAAPAVTQTPPEPTPAAQ